jgi:hypothetical protein
VLLLQNAPLLVDRQIRPRGLLDRGKIGIFIIFFYLAKKGKDTN